ncbi:MAG: DMT family transporter [Lachnospiraceae bacterium]|nr:DMT family transporter [Lachnospiraceae bacterium]
MKKAAPALILAAGTLWGIMGIFVRKLGTYGFSSIQIASLRIIFGALIFFAITAVAKRELLKIKVQDVGIFIGMGLISLLLFTICYFTTINMASLSVAAILLYTSPIWVMLMSLVCFREKMTKRKVLAVVMAFVGCVLVSGIGGATQLSFKIIGIGLMSAVGYGLYSIFGTFALRKYSPLTVTTYAFLFGAIGALFVCNPTEIVDIVCRSDEQSFLIMLILLTAFITAVLPYLLYTMGLAAMRASSAAIMASVEPVVATIAGVVVFREAMTAAAFAGILLVIGAIIILNLKPEKKQPDD